MITALAVLAVSALAQGAIADAKLLGALAAKVSEIGEKDKIDPQVAAFLRLPGKEVRWHSKFDSERQVQLCGDKKDRRLIFLVPEKPFPEFGKTWVYCIGVDGKLQRSGVAGPREPFKALTDAKANAKAAKVEVDYWLKALEIVKA